MRDKIESSCIYCGCGCRLNYEVADNEIVKVRGVARDDVSDGAPCVKGLTIHEVFDKNRIEKPLIKGKPVTLKKALDYVYKKTKDLAPNEVFFNTSGKVTNEDNYVIEKFARTCYKTPNIDSCCGRLCHNATVMGMKNVFGAPNLTLMKNIEKIDTLLIIGSEPDKNYPVFYNKILRRKDLKVFKIHSFIKGAGREEVITIKPSSETCLLNGLINELLDNHVTSRAEGLNRLKGAVMEYTPSMVCETCGLKKKDYNKLVKAVIKSKRFGVFHGMGLTQHVNSIENVHSLLNLVLLKKASILSLRGEINVQGAGDLSGSSCKGVKCKGLNIIEALLLSPAKALFLTEFDPFKSMPDLNELKQETKKSFIVYFGSYHNTTSGRADVVIPIASLLGSEGSITNGERRIRKVNKVRVEGLQLWRILRRFSKKFRKSKEFNYVGSKAIFKEITNNVEDYSQVNVGALWNGVDQWADKTIKHKVFMPEEFDGLSDFTSDKYPFILTTFRSRYAFLSNEVTKNSPTLSKRTEKPGFYLNPDDMNKMGLNDGDKAVVSSTTSSLKGRAYSSERMPLGVIGAYMHFSSLMINKLFPLKFDEESFTPNYKSVAVNVKKK